MILFPSHMVQIKRPLGLRSHEYHDSQVQKRQFVLFDVMPDLFKFALWML